MKLSGIVKTLLIIAAVGILLWALFSWFGETADDSISDYDGGRGKYEDQVDQAAQ